MPIRQFLNGERFDPDTTRIMGVAFEMACVALRLADRGDLAKAVVAEKIIELAKAGERDANTLCERSLNELAPAGKLQEAGLIRYRRGRIIILDKAGLEHLACECYRAIRRRTEGVVPPTQRKVLRSLGAGRITLHGEDRASLAAGTLNIGEQSTMGADHDGVDR